MECKCSFDRNDELRGYPVGCSGDESDSRLPDFTIKPHRNNLFRLIVSELNPDSIGTILLLPRLYVSNFSIRNFSTNSHQNTLLQDSTKRIVLLESLYH